MAKREDEAAISVPSDLRNTPTECGMWRSFRCGFKQTNAGRVFVGQPGNGEPQPSFRSHEGNSSGSVVCGNDTAIIYVKSLSVRDAYGRVCG